MNALFAEDALLPDGWAKNVSLRWSSAGDFTEVQRDSQPARDCALACGPVIAGMPNLHSHAFQRAFGGLTELRGQPDDSFWSWRKLMYGFAKQLTPEALQAIARWLYVEMLEAGYTSVCEFHYVHHAEDGAAYADDATLSEVLLRAAQEVGIGITLLPVLYQSSGFGALPANAGQRRFIRSTDSMLALLQRLAPLVETGGGGQMALGLAPHSLRAVPPESLRIAVAGLHSLLPQAPVHIHIAEQRQEVEDCLAWSGRRPVQWLMAHAPVDARWCLVHATHMNPEEYRSAAQSGAVAGLCPTTEANLGDGIFDALRWTTQGGRWGIGSDSHACVNPAEELLTLEYSQRLARHARNVLGTAEHNQVATAMTLQAVAGGAQASGRPIGGLAAGQRADFVVLDGTHLALAGLPAPYAHAGHIFASHRSSAIADVWVGGKQCVQAGQHPLRERLQAEFVRTRTHMFQRALEA